MSTAHTPTATDSTAKRTQISTLSEEEEDDDDICPVCESECTCRKGADVATPNFVPHTAASTSSERRIVSSGEVPSLKIRLVLPPHIKYRRGDTIVTHNAGASSVPSRSMPEVRDPLKDVYDGFQSQVPTTAVKQLPMRRVGRPPKSMVPAKAHSDLQQMSQKDFTELANTGSRIIPRPVSSARGLPLARHRVSVALVGGLSRARGNASSPSPRRSLTRMAAVDSDVRDAPPDELPTFIPAASISSRCSSSDSSASESSVLSSESSEDDEITAEPSGHNRRHRLKDDRDVFDEDPHRKRREQILNRWEIRSRRKSAGPDEGASDSEGTTGNDGAAAEDEEDEDEGEGEDEDRDDDGDDEAEGETDVEKEGSMDADQDDDVVEERLGDDGLGVSFTGVSTGWSEDEESSFDADLFFANLDDSDSDSSVTPRQTVAKLSDPDSDTDNTVSFSADEDDALFLMDVDPTTHVRRDRGGFEFGVALSGLSSAWDEPPVSTSVDCNSDIEMSLEGSSGSTTDESANAGNTDLSLDETDGETTEDELVDSNGLPNSRAMMLFRWPTLVSTVDPLSTMSSSANLPSTDSQSPSTSFQSQNGPTPPTPAEILAGRVSLDDYDESERNHVHTYSGHATMGLFVPSNGFPHAFAIVDGSGTPSTPFPRRRRGNSAGLPPAQLDITLEPEVCISTCSLIVMN